MKRCCCLALLAAILLFQPGLVHAQAPIDGSVTGVVVDPSNRGGLEDATVALRSRADSTRVVGTITAKDGGFSFTHVPLGSYVVECSLIGHTPFRSPPFTLTEATPHVALPTISLKPTTLVLKEVEVSANRGLFGQNADRRVYNVDHDVMAQSSTASDLLQNIPSVQVDIDGNVSLRGSGDVTILVNGKKSPLMGKSRADVLQQLPAAGIERIEVITNPSARFTPEGGSGIINLVMKSGADASSSGDVTGHLGTAGRSNENLTFGVHPGKFDLFASYSHRDDRRNRHGLDDRVLSGVGSTASYREDNRIAMRPRVHMGNLGVTYHVDPKDELELTGEYLRRRPSRDGLSTIVTRDSSNAILTDYDRFQTGYELETESGLTTAFQHDFAKPEHQVRLEINASNNPQSEHAHFVEHWRAPAQPDPVSDVVLSTTEKQGHVTLDYTNPVNDESKVEAGYALDVNRQDIRSDADSLDVTRQVLLADPFKTYRFRLDQAIHAVYGTYQRSLGAFDVVAGAREEVATIKSDLISSGLPFTDRYAALYPTLHVNYKLSARDELRLSYSRRVRRPESDDLNPFPEFTDPYNIDEGNPRLRPESTHSFELGYGIHGDHASFVPTLYYRYKTNAFTRVTEALTDTTFLRTMANLASDQSAGLEPVLTLSAGRWLQANVNANVFREQIDASNLGFAGKKSVTSWSGTGNVMLTPWTRTMLELNANYRSARLTPQGNVRPSFGLNVGARQNLYGDRVSLTLAVSDLLKTQRQETLLDVTGIQQHVTTRRDSRVLYVGLSYHYGQAEKKKDKPIQYEDQP